MPGPADKPPSLTGILKPSDLPDAPTAKASAPVDLAAKFRIRRERKPDDLRGTLMFVFALLAIAPMIVAVIAMTQAAKSGIEISTSDLERISKETLMETSGTIGATAQKQIEGTGKDLTDIGSKAVRDTSTALLTATEKRFAEANQQLIAQGEDANNAIADQLMAQSEKATEELARQLIRVSSESNRELAKETAKLAETAVGGVADSLVEQASRNTSQISQAVVAQNTESAKRLSERMLQDIDREPVVNFKNLATIFAQGIASNKVQPIKDGYLAVVDGRGRVIASTRYKKGTTLRHLAIVGLALDGAAPEDTLVRFAEGPDTYLGVFARRPAGGAVVFAYLADRARVDTERMQADVQKTLNQMGQASSAYVVKQLDAQKPVMRREATRLSQAAVSKLEATNRALSAKTAERMRKQGDAVSARTMFDMAVEAKTTAAGKTRAMKEKSAAIAKQAVAQMRPIGGEYAGKAEAAMRAEATKAVAATAEIIPQAAGEASQKAGARMAEKARGLADKAVGEMWLIAIVLIGIEIAIAVLASLMMSGRIAAPILARMQKSREEQERLGREMEIASKIQTCLLPPVPVLRDFDVALSMVPAEEVGGDFVDLVPAAQPGRFWIGVGDVTGHGLTPGLIMMMAQSTFNAFVQDPLMTPKRLYDGMNRVLYQNIKDRLRTSDHMTMSILEHKRDGEFVHCGSHLDVLIYRAATGAVERIETEGPWVGMLPDCQDFTTEVGFKLGPDDVLLLYTDGLIELQDAKDEQWDMDRLCASLARHAKLDAREIQAKVLQEALTWANQILDDISMVVVKRLPVEADLAGIDPNDSTRAVVPGARLLSKLGRRDG